MYKLQGRISSRHPHIEWDPDSDDCPQTLSSRRKKRQERKTDSGVVFLEAPDELEQASPYESQVLRGRARIRD